MSVLQMSVWTSILLLRFKSDEIYILLIYDSQWDFNSVFLRHGVGGKQEVFLSTSTKVHVNLPFHPSSPSRPLKTPSQVSYPSPRVHWKIQIVEFSDWAVDLSFFSMEFNFRRVQRSHRRAVLESQQNGEDELFSSIQNRPIRYRQTVWNPNNRDMNTAVSWPGQHI